MDGINAARQTIPLARFDAVRCKQGLECLREYKTEWDEKARVFKKTPAHNWASHGADAWRYLAVSWRDPQRPEEENPRPSFKPMNEMTIGEFIDFDEGPRRQERV